MESRDFFAYDDGKQVTNNAFRISASQVSKFFDTTAAWYREHLLGEAGFAGNTATELGNCVHAGIAMYVTTGIVDYAKIDAYISTLPPEIDRTHIFSQYGPMLDAALPYVDRHRPAEVEKFVFHELFPGIVAGGSIDAIMGSVVKQEDGSLVYPQDVTITDWKTTSQKTAPTKFPRNYWFQQMVYAWILRQQNINVRWIKLVYITQSEMGRISEKTGKALKDYPSEVSVVTEEVTDANLELIGSCLQLIAESVKTWNDKPELRYLLAQDLRLRERPKLVLDK